MTNGVNGILDKALVDLLALWRSRGGGGELPPQSAFDAFTLHGWLPNLLLVEVHDAPKRFYYRLTGTAIDERYGRNFTGRWLEDLRIPGSEGYWEMQYARVAELRQPLAGNIVEYDEKQNQKPCVWLMLPLRRDRPAHGGGTATDLVILACVLFAAGDFRLRR